MPGSRLAPISRRNPNPLRWKSPLILQEICSEWARFCTGSVSFRLLWAPDLSSAVCHSSSDVEQPKWAGLIVYSDLCLAQLKVLQLVLLCCTSALNTGVIRPPLSANATSTPLTPRQQKIKHVSLVFWRFWMRPICSNHIGIHGEVTTFITPAAACTVQSSNRDAGSVVTTVTLSSRDIRGGGGGGNLQITWWDSSNLCGSRSSFIHCVETCHVLLGLGNCVVWNTNRQATLNPWRRGLQWTGEEAVTQPNCCTRICIPAIYTNQKTWAEFGQTWTVWKSVAITHKIFLSKRDSVGGERHNKK